MLESNYIARQRQLQGYMNERSLNERSLCSSRPGRESSSIHAMQQHSPPVSASLQPWMIYDAFYAQRRHLLHRSAATAPSLVREESGRGRKLQFKDWQLQISDRGNYGLAYAKVQFCP